MVTATLQDEGSSILQAPNLVILDSCSPFSKPKPKWSLTANLTMSPALPTPLLPPGLSASLPRVGHKTVPAMTPSRLLPPSPAAAALTADTHSFLFWEATYWGAHIPPPSPSVFQPWSDGVMGPQRAAHPHLEESFAVQFTVPSQPWTKSQWDFTQQSLLTLVTLPHSAWLFLTVAPWILHFVSLQPWEALSETPATSQLPDTASHASFTLLPHSRKAGLSPPRGCQFQKRPCVFLSTTPSLMPGVFSGFARWS